MITAEEALVRLKDGNRRFVEGDRQRRVVAGPAERGELVAGQEPFAVILGCSDSRVPAGIVFDQGLGDLFVIRVAGNIAGESQLGSIEFAVEQLGARLVVVMGHTNCGAVSAALEAGELGGSLGILVDRVRENIGEAREDAVRANVRATVAQLEGAVDATVVGAEYSLETGVVTFLS